MQTQRLNLQELTPLGDEPVIPAPTQNEEAEEKEENPPPSASQPVPPSPPENTFTEEELEKSKASAYEAGKEAGRIEGQQAALNEKNSETELLNRTIAQLLENLHTKINTLFTSVENDNPKQVAPLVTHLAFGIIQKIMHNTADEHTRQQIEHLATEAFNLLFDEPNLTLYVHDSMKSPIQEVLDTLKNNAGFQGAVALKTDASLEPTDCKIAWHDGCIIHSEAALWDDIKRILQLNITNDANTNNADTIENENNIQQL